MCLLTHPSHVTFVPPPGILDMNMTAVLMEANTATDKVADKVEFKND